MIKFELQNGLVEQIRYEDGQGGINPWGIETADSRGFFSLDQSVGQHYTIISDKFNDISQTSIKRTIIVKMAEGLWQLTYSDVIIHDQTIRREALLLALEDTILMDFVLRFRFLKDRFTMGKINGTSYQHQNSNTYYQFPVTTASVYGEKNSATVSIDDFQTTASFEPNLYIRDRHDEWIIHARMIPVIQYKEVIKLCNRWCKTAPLPQILSDLILSSKQIREKLWYRNERKPYTSKIAKLINPNAFGMGLLKKGESLRWVTTCRLS